MRSFSELDFLDFPTFLGFSLLLFFIIFIRYLIVSGAYHYTFFKLLRKKYQDRIITTQKLEKDQLTNEIRMSAISAVIFALVGVGALVLWQEGFTKIYTTSTDYKLWYIPISIVLVLLLQDTYYYWSHRWMHKPNILKYFHIVHHKSIHTSVLTAFSFHPYETILQAIFMPVVILIIPLHLYAVFFLLLVMTISATINHAGVEIFPRSWKKHWFAKWLIGASHHDLHHKEFRYNYGLYFTFWDKLMGTESPNYENVT